MNPSESRTQRAVALCRTTNGAAIACTCCSRVQFSLGNARFMSEPNEIAAMLVRLGPFRRLRPSAQHAFQQARRGQTVRNHVVHMGGEGTAFLFHDGEMSELCHLLEGAHVALQRRRIVRPPARPSGPNATMLH